VGVVSAQSKPQENLERLVEMDQLLHQVEMLQIDDLIETLQARREKPTPFEELEIEKVSGHIQRHLQLQEKYWLVQEKKERELLKIVILGNSATFYDSKGYNQAVLSDLLNYIRIVQPDAVFFLGNLLHVEDKKNYREHLNRFISLIHFYLPNVPFYPLPGAQEVEADNTLSIFKDDFVISDAQLFDSKQLGYAVHVGNALFALISTRYYENTKQKAVVGILPSELDWLGQTLKKEAGKNRFSFVMGADAAFSTTSSFGNYLGLDKQQEERNRFWGLLREFNVLAYFSANEILFDRSNRYGIWQLITGGAGAVPDKVWEEEDVFYHFILLNLPQNNVDHPSIEVYDRKGRRRDFFEFSSNTFPFYQVQINKSIQEGVPEATKTP